MPNERTSSVLPVSFFDENNEPVIPQSGTYRIDDVASGVAILASTPLPSLAAVVNLEITANQNRILNAANSIETRRVTVAIIFDTDKGSTAEYFYNVINLFGVS